MQHKTGSRKDGTGPAEGQLPEMRDGFRIMRLVMSINYSRIFPITYTPAGNEMLKIFIILHRIQ